MVTREDIGRRVVVQAADSFYQFIDGWTGTLNGFESGFAVMHQTDDTTALGFRQFLVPPEQVHIAILN